MAYTKQEFQSGAKLYASELNAMDDQIYDNTEKISGLEEALENATIENAPSIEWLRINGVKTKKYRLNGQVYRYESREVDIIFNANDGTSKWCNTVPATYNTESYKQGVWTSPCIEVDQSKIGSTTEEVHKNPITIDGLEKLVPAYNNSALWIGYYKADGTRLAIDKAALLLEKTSQGADGTEIPLSVTFSLCHSNFYDTRWQTVAYIRVVLGIAIDRDITTDDIKDLQVKIPCYNRTETISDWYSTGEVSSTDPAVQENANNIASLQERMTTAEETLERIASGVSTEPLFPKLGLIGDSLTNQEYQGWQALTVSMLGNPVWHKNAITGSSMANYGDGRETNYTPFVERYLNTPSDCDCVIIMGGSNDATYQYNYDMGTVGVLANNNYIGAYCTIIEGLLTRNPATRIMLMTPPRFYSTSTGELNAHIEKYVNATKEIAEFYGLPCLDLFNTLGWNRITKEWASWNWDGNDPIHLSNAIGPRVGRMVANFIRNNY